MSIPFPEPTARRPPAPRCWSAISTTSAPWSCPRSTDCRRPARGSILPSGWSPLELVKHLTFVEMRWLEWGFEGTPVDDPWGDQRQDRWYVGPDETIPRTWPPPWPDGASSPRRSPRRHDLDEIGAPGERWDGAPPATLERCLLHLVQEYARHLGHLDVVRELLDGRTGES